MFLLNINFTLGWSFPYKRRKGSKDAPAVSDAVFFFIFRSNILSQKKLLKKGRIAYKSIESGFSLESCDNRQCEKNKM